MEYIIGICWGTSIVMATCLRRRERTTKLESKICIFILCLVTGGLLSWYVPYLIGLREDSEAMVPDLVTCKEICSELFTQKDTDPDTCCFNYLCYTKEDCRNSSINYLKIAIIINSCFLGLSGIYVVGLPLYAIIQRKLRNENPLLETQIDIENGSGNENLEPLHLGDSEANRGGVCSICLDDLGEDNLTLEGCRHTFHRNCLREWNRVHNYCNSCGQRY